MAAATSSSPSKKPLGPLKITPRPYISFVGNRMLLCGSKESEIEFRSKMRATCPTEQSRLQALETVKQVETEQRWRRAHDERQAKKWLEANEVLDVTMNSSISGGSARLNSSLRSLSKRSNSPRSPSNDGGGSKARIITNNPESFPTSDLFGAAQPMYYSDRPIDDPDASSYPPADPATETNGVENPEEELQEEEDAQDGMPMNSNGEIMLYMDRVRLEQARIRGERKKAKEWVIAMREQAILAERAERCRGLTETVLALRNGRAAGGGDLDQDTATASSSSEGGGGGPRTGVVTDHLAEAAQCARLWLKYAQQRDEDAEIRRTLAQRAAILENRGALSAPLLMHDREFNGVDVGEHLERKQRNPPGRTRQQKSPKKRHPKEGKLGSLKEGGPQIPEGNSNGV